MRSMIAVGLLFSAAMFAQEPPVAKPVDENKEKLKALVFELDNEENEAKLKQAHKKECEKIIKDNCFSCHNNTAKNDPIKLFDDKDEVALQDNKETLVKFVENEKLFDGCKKLEEKHKLRIKKYFER